MKKTIVLLSLVSFSLISQAADELRASSKKARKEISYVITGEKSYFSHDARIIFNRIRMYMEDGVILTIPMRNVDAYRIDGSVFHRLPLVDKSGTDRGTALLEFVAVRNDLNLYRYSSMDTRLGCCFEDNRGKTGIYLVYRGDKFHVSVNENNFRTLLPFFGVRTLPANSNYAL